MKIFNPRADIILNKKGYYLCAGRSSCNYNTYVNNYNGVEYTITVHYNKHLESYVSYPFAIKDRETIKHITIAQNRVNADIEELRGRKWKKSK